MQFIEKEYPCPLCLMQRMAMFGVIYGMLMNVLYRIKPLNYGISILSALLGITLSVRQILLHICPNADGSLTGYGKPVLDIHLYTWALIFLFIATIALTILSMAYKEDFKTLQIPSDLLKVGKFAFYIVATIALGNLIFTFLECALGICPDDPTEYMLLKGKYF